MDTRHRSVWDDFDRHAHACLRRSSFELGTYPEPALARARVTAPLGRETTGHALYRIADRSVVGVSLRWEYVLNEGWFAQKGAVRDPFGGLKEHVISDCASVDPHGVDQLLNALVSARLPAGPMPETIGIDGVWYELELGEWFHNGWFRWWLHPPRGWKPLDTFLYGMIQLIQAGIAEARPIDRQSDEH